MDLIKLCEATLLKSVHRGLVVVNVDEVLFAVWVTPQVSVKLNLLYLLNALRVG